MTHRPVLSNTTTFNTIFGDDGDDVFLFITRTKRTNFSRPHPTSNFDGIKFSKCHCFYDFIIINYCRCWGVGIVDVAVGIIESFQRK